MVFTPHLRTPGAVLLVIVLAACHAAGPDGASDPPRESQVTQVLRGSLFQSEDGRVLRDAVVVVAGDRVVCSGAATTCSYPGDAEVRHVTGTILPGLIDLHVHSRPSYMGAFVPAGVTTIRDATNSLAVMDRLKSHPHGPRVLASGPLLDGPASTMTQMSPTAGSIGEHPLDQLVPVLVDDSIAAARAVGVLAENGVDFIKLYQRLPRGAFMAAVAAAHARGLPIAVDLGMIFTGGLHGSEIDIVEAADAGVSTLEHLSGLALAYQRRGGDPLDPPHDPEIIDEIARELLRKDVAAVPTLATFVQLADSTALSSQEVPGADLRAYFEPHWQGIRAMAKDRPQSVKADQALTRALLERLHDGNMLIGAGSDLPAAPNMVPGGALHLELEALVTAGFSPTEALLAATTNAATILGLEDVGHLREGARADIVIVDGDPTRDITASRRIQSVWFGGTEVDLEGAWARTASALEAAMGGASPSEEPFEAELLLPPLDGYVTDDDADPGELMASLDHGAVPYVDVRRRRILDERGFALGEVTVITFQSESDGARSYLTHRYGSPAQSPARIAGVEMVRIEAEPFAALVWKRPTFVVTFERGQEVSDAWLEELARSTVRSIIDRED